jgi:hypothetical protein
MLRIIFGVGVCAVLLSGCGIEPQPPGLLVSTTPPGAACTVARPGKPMLDVGPTPAIARVDPADNTPISVTCRRQGFADAAATVPGGGSSPASPDRIDIALVPKPPGATH